MACHHADAERCFRTIFPTNFDYCGFVTGQAYFLRLAVEASLAHPDCYLRLQETLRSDIALVAQELSMSDAARQLQDMCAGASQPCDDVPGH